MSRLTDQEVFAAWHEVQNLGLSQGVQRAMAGRLLEAQNRSQAEAIAAARRRWAESELLWPDDYLYEEWPDDRRYYEEE